MVWALTAVLKLVTGTDLLSERKGLSPPSSLFIGPHGLEHPHWGCARHRQVSPLWHVAGAGAGLQLLVRDWRRRRRRTCIPLIMQNLHVRRNSFSLSTCIVAAWHKKGFLRKRCMQ